MKKRGLRVLCAILGMVIILAIPTFAEENVKVYVDDVQVEFDVQPQLIGGRTMVPLRAIFEALGATVQWDGETKTITAYNEAYFVKATIDNTTMTVNGENKEMDIAPMIVEDRTLVPARFVAEAFDCNVEWNGETKTVSITTSKIDYNNLEQATEKKDNPVEEKSNTNIEEMGYGTVRQEYYTGTTLPDYTFVTNVNLKDVYYGDSAVTYINPNTKVGQYSEVVDYMSYLEENGWSEYKNKKDVGHITWYFVKNSDLVGVAYYSEYDEVWITFTK